MRIFTIEPWTGPARQVEDLHALGEWAYIATDACIFKTLDEALEFGWIMCVFFLVDLL